MTDPIHELINSRVPAQNTKQPADVKPILQATVWMCGWWIGIMGGPVQRFEGGKWSLLMNGSAYESS